VGRPAGSAGGPLGWRGGAPNGGGLGGVPEEGNETFRRVANVDALGKCRQICYLFVGKKWSMSGNSGRCRGMVDVVGEWWSLSGNSGRCRGKVEQVGKNMPFAREIFVRSPHRRWHSTWSTSMCCSSLGNLPSPVALRQKLKMQVRTE
jgi:hypothetical protein